MSHLANNVKDAGHLFIVAGYPTLGKSSLLWKAARTGFPLFGRGHDAVVPQAETLRGIDENSDTATKLRSGFWLTLADIPHLNEAESLPARLILHLDLLLAYLLYRTKTNSVPAVDEIGTLFHSLFDQLALRSYEKCTVTTLYAPIEEVQRRWRHRYPAGLPTNCSRIITAKDRLINDGAAAVPLFTAILGAWAAFLESLSDRDILVDQVRLGSRIRPGAATAG